LGIAATRIQRATRLLRTSGILIDAVHYGPGFAHVVATRIDDLGVSLRYVIGIVDADVPDGALHVMRQSASHHGAALVVVSDDPPVEASWLGWTDFLARFGGLVPSLLPLGPDLVYRPMDGGWVGQREQSHDRVVRSGVTEQQFTDFVKSLDAPTRDYFISRVERPSLRRAAEQPAPYEWT
jgi:hypothetical protein